MTTRPAPSGSRYPLPAPFCAVLACFGMVVAGCPQQGTTPGGVPESGHSNQPTPTHLFLPLATPFPSRANQTVERTTDSPATALATLDGNRNNIAAYDLLLGRLTQKYPESRERIVDITAGVFKVCQGRGKPVRCIKIMQVLAALRAIGKRMRIRYKPMLNLNSPCSSSS